MNAVLNLEPINEAFGESADLYKDVLGVKANAGGDQIQRAYFDRRNELFQLLAELESSTKVDSINATRRMQAERKMDAIVMTLRILGDKSLRAQYDDVRMERIALRSKQKGAAKPDSSAPKTTYSMADDQGEIPLKPKSVLKKSSYNNSVVEVDSSFENTAFGEISEFTPGTSTFSTRIIPQTTPERPERTNSTSAVSFGTPSSSKQSSSKRDKNKSKRKANRISPDTPRNGSSSRKKQTPEVLDTMDSTVAESDDDRSVLSGGSFRTMETTLTTYEKNRGYFQTIREEIMGALDDTSQSFHQVFSVFTLREDEIDAVAGRIDKARRQMIHSFANN